MARYFHTSTTVSGPTAVQVNNYGNTDFLGLHATNNTASAYYIKLAWQSQPNQVLFPTAAASTAVPAITIEVPITGLNFHGNFPVTNQGSLYMWVASTAPDNTNTTLSAGGDVITVIYD